MKFIDTHTHLYVEEFDADRREAVRRAVAAGAQALLLPNIDAASLPRMLQMCRDYPGLCFPMLGLHPTELPRRPMELLDEWEQLLEGPHPYVAIGEVGIDLYWDASRREEQVAVFRRQAEWAARHRLPLVVHSRAAHRDLADTLAPLRDTLCGGIFHCFGGTEEEARELLSFPGFCLGIGGTVTFKKSTLPEVLKNAVPVERIVVETDSPYLAPAPHRGQRNESSLVPLVIARLADIYGLSADALSERLLANTRQLFPALERAGADEA